MSLVVVAGATGVQGGSVARTLANDPAWKVRGISRDSNSAKAKELEALGIEMVTADLNNAETLPKAFEGATAIFITTNFWEIAIKHGIDAAEKGETQQFINAANVASKVPTLKHLVLSTMPNCDTLSRGKFPCPHWDSKARGGEYVKRELPQLANKTSYVWLGWYLDNMIDQVLMQPHPFLGSYLLVAPSKADAIVPVAGIVSVNTGLVVQAVLAQPKKTYGKNVPVLTDSISWIQVIEGWSKTTGKNGLYAELPDSEAVKLYGPIVGPEMARQFRFSEEYPDWWSYYPQDTLSIEQLGIKDKVIGFSDGLVRIKEQITPSA